jgi:hypothetical protein
VLQRLPKRLLDQRHCKYVDPVHLQLPERHDADRDPVLGGHLPDRYQLDRRPVLRRLPVRLHDQWRGHKLDSVHPDLPNRIDNHGHHLRSMPKRIPDTFRQHLLRKLYRHGQPEQHRAMSVVLGGDIECNDCAVHRLPDR